MLSLLGSLLGFATSFLPKVMEHVQDRRDKAHELAMIEAQTEAQVRLEGVRLEAMHASADIREGEALWKHDSRLNAHASPWVVDLAASVRPVLSYLFFAEFLGLSLCVNAGWMSLDQYAAVWSDDAQAIFAAIVSFWFGSRTMARRAHT